MERSYLLFFREQPPGTLIEDISITDVFTTETPFESSSSHSDYSSASASDTASPASSGTSTMVSQTFVPPSSPTPTTEPPREKEANKAWIAGVVIGIVGLVAVGGMGFYLWRQRQQKHAYGAAPQGPHQALQVPPGHPPQQWIYHSPQQAPYGNGPSPMMQPVSPSASAYDAQTYYGNIAKPMEVHSAHDAFAGNGSPPGISTVHMPPGVAHLQSHSAVNIHDLPELANSRR